MEDIPWITLGVRRQIPQKKKRGTMACRTLYDHGKSGFVMEKKMATTTGFWVKWIGLVMEKKMETTEIIGII